VHSLHFCGVEAYAEKLPSKLAEELVQEELPSSSEKMPLSDSSSKPKVNFIERNKQLASRKNSAGRSQPQKQSSKKDSLKNEKGALKAEGFSSFFDVDLSESVSSWQSRGPQIKAKKPSALVGAPRLSGAADN
jgi:hypothetical protein